MHFLNSGDGCIKLAGVFKASYCSCRDPKDLLEKLDQMESKGLRYVSLNIWALFLIND